MVLDNWKVSYVLGGFSCLGLLLSVLLYICDKTQNKSMLNTPDKKNVMAEVLASPAPGMTPQIRNDPEISENMKAYKTDPGKRNALKRSIARSSVAK